MPLGLRNFILSQVGWFACALGPRYGVAWFGPVVTIGVVAIHLYSAKRPAQEFRLLAATMAIGIVFDAATALAGLIAYPVAGIVPGLQPWFMVALWALFATMLNVSLRWLKAHSALAAALGAILGPIAYWSGVRLGALYVLKPLPATIVLAIGWAIIMVVLIALAHRYDGYELTPGKPVPA
jgi:hypothetical protein